MDLVRLGVLNDDELARLAAAGDRSAFGLLIGRHDRQLAAWLMRQVEQSADAEDVLQEVLLKAWKSASTFQGGSYRAWIFRVARSCLADWARRNRRNSASGLADAPEPVDPSARSALDQTAAVERCLGRLDERSRLLIRARFGGDEDLPAVCSRLGVEKKTAQNLLSMALNRLRECVERRGGE
jgi:RNA polymerase sigma-70 factor (ECF subfamily)